MEDFSHKYRKKNRFIIELRYSPKLVLLDSKGKIIEQLHKEINNRYPIWQANQGEIVFTNNQEIPTEEFLLGFKRCSIITEDIKTYEDFKQNAFSLIEKAYDILKIDFIERVGFRIISAYTSDKISDFPTARKKVEDAFLKDPINLGLRHKDLFIKIVHQNGYYLVGPLNKEENWLKENFKDIEDEKRIPKYGIGVDIDSYGNNYKISNLKELNK